MGFPGETMEDFEETLDIVRKVRFDSLFTFIYSPRKGTPAEKMQEVLTPQEKQANFNRLVKLQNKISLEKNNEYLGKKVEVLVEGTSKNNLDILTGRTRTGKIVNFKGDNKTIGNLIDITITKVKTWSLEGEV